MRGCKVRVMERRIFRQTKKKIANLIGNQKRICLSVFLLMVGVLCIFLGVRDYCGVLKGQNQSITLFGVVEDATGVEYIQDMENVRNASVYQESMVELQYGEYKGEFVIYGFEQEYLDLQYGEEMLVDMEGEMPYILLDDKAISSLKNASGNRMDAEKDYSLETMTVAGQKLARVCGIIPMEDKEMEPCIYTNLQGIEVLVDSEESLETSDGTQGLGEATVSGNIVGSSYVILTKSGRKLEKLMEEIRENGVAIELTQELQNQIYEWNEKELLGQGRFAVGCVLILCACMAFYAQLQLWEREHLNFVQWLSHIDAEEKCMKEVIIQCWKCFLRKGFLLGGVAFLLVGVFV